MSTLESQTITFETGGLVVSVSNPWLAASPNRLVFDPLKDPPKKLVELKNLYTVRDMILEEDAMNCKAFYLEITADGNLQLKRGHDFYYQMQCAIQIDSGVI